MFPTIRISTANVVAAGTQPSGTFAASVAIVTGLSMASRPNIPHDISASIRAEAIGSAVRAQAWSSATRDTI